jgi:Zn-dependent membrane protease YugP
MFFFDPMYLWMVLIPGLLLSGGASLLVRSAFGYYSRVGSQRGYTGAQAAQLLLDRAGIHDVRVVRVPGHLTDHYDPTNKVLALSDNVYSSNSVAAIGVATHEAGHAIQHATGYLPLHLRAMTVPIANIGSSLGPLVIIGGLLLMATAGALGKVVFLIGIALFSGTLLFQLITLPVEFDASARAKRLVVEAGIVQRQETTGIHAVLNAAALTYVAAAVSTILTLLYYLMQSGLLGGREE